MSEVYLRDFQLLFGADELVPDTAYDFSFRFSGTARDFSRVLSKRLCDFTALAFGLAFEAPVAEAVTLLTFPCGVILHDVLIPLTEKLEDEGLCFLASLSQETNRQAS